MHPNLFAVKTLISSNRYIVVYSDGLEQFILNMYSFSGYNFDVENAMTRKSFSSYGGALH